jgi:hypothetical protein
MKIYFVRLDEVKNKTEIKQFKMAKPEDLSIIVL